MINRLSLEHPLVAHCNLRCANCDHGSPLQLPEFSDVEQFGRDINALQRVLRVKTLKLVGGEPLLHPDISVFVKLAKQSSIAERIQIWTNGLLLHRFNPGDLDGCDDLVISTYPGVGQRWDVDTVRILSAESTFRVHVKPTEMFFKIDAEAGRSDSEISATFLSCKNAHAWSCHSFLNGFYYKCSRAQMLGKGLGGAELSDAVDIHGFIDLERKLDAYLSSDNPLKACTTCLGTSGPMEPHRQRTSKI